jgi:hypothetical protein
VERAEDAGGGAAERETRGDAAALRRGGERPRFRDDLADPTTVSGGLERSGGIEMGPQGTAALPRGVLSHPVLQGTAALTGAGPRVEGSRWGGGGPQALRAMFDLNKIRSLELSKDALCDCFTDVGGGCLGLS